MASSPARPKEGYFEPEEQQASRSDPIYLRQRFHGELGQMLRDYYADVAGEPIPERLLRLVEQFRQRGQSQ